MTSAFILLMGVNMKISKKLKTALVLLAVTSVCVSSQSLRGFVRGIQNGIEKSVSDAILGSTVYDVKNYKSKKPAKLSKEASVQKMSKLLDKSEQALLKKDYKTSQKYYDEACKVSFTEKTPEADAIALSTWMSDIGTYLEYLNPDNQRYKGEK